MTTECSLTSCCCPPATKILLCMTTECSLTSCCCSLDTKILLRTTECSLTSCCGPPDTKIWLCMTTECSLISCCCPLLQKSYYVWLLNIPWLVAAVPCYKNLTMYDYWVFSDMLLLSPATKILLCMTTECSLTSCCCPPNTKLLLCMTTECSLTSCCCPPIQKSYYVWLLSVSWQVAVVPWYQNCTTYDSWVGRGQHSVAEHWTCDWQVTGSIPSKSSRRIFLS